MPLLERSGARRGLTLLEVIVALALSGIILLGARLMLAGVGDGAARTAERADAAMGAANAEHLLRSLVVRLEVGTTKETEFEGGERLARFTTWCEVPSGWLERCRASLIIDTAGTAPVVRAALSTGEVLTVARGFESAKLRYLVDANAGGSWFVSWGKSITAPLAIGLIVDRDTTILRIGERG